MSTKEYLLQWALWAAILPGLVGAITILAFSCFMNPGVFSLVLLILVLFLFIRFCYFVRKFHVTARNGGLPESFFVRILPFFLPLFYTTLILLAVGFYPYVSS